MYEIKFEKKNFFGKKYLGTIKIYKKYFKKICGFFTTVGQIKIQENSELYQKI